MVRAWLLEMRDNLGKSLARPAAADLHHEVA
jgi:hypothetical protein